MADPQSRLVKFLWTAFGALGAVVGLVLAIHFLLVHERAAGYAEGKKAAETAQTTSNAVAQTKIAGKVAAAVEHHAAAAAIVDHIAEETTDAIEDASDLDGVLAGHRTGIDQLRAQAAAQPALY